MTDATPSSASPLERAAAAACDELGLDGDDRMLVEVLMQQRPMRWPACCNGGCSDCVKPVRAAATRALALLGEPKP